MISLPPTQVCLSKIKEPTRPIADLDLNQRRKRLVDGVDADNKDDTRELLRTSKTPKDRRLPRLSLKLERRDPEEKGPWSYGNIQTNRPFFGKGWE